MTDKHLDCPIGSPGKIRTFSGKLVNPFQLSPDDVHIEDIAHALSQLCRFTGHTRFFYSVGEHCLLVCSMLSATRVKLAGLVHDAGEAYFNDMAGPLKRRLDMAEYNTAEHRAAAMITEKFCGVLSERELQLVKKADADAYHIERAALMRPGFKEPYEGNPYELGAKSMDTIEWKFSKAFHILTNDLQKGK